MELNWIINFSADKIPENDFDSIWSLIKKEILIESIDHYNWSAASDLPDSLKKPNKINGEINTQGELCSHDIHSINRILDNIKGELNKINIDFIFSALSINQIDSSVFYDSKKNIHEER